MKLTPTQASAMKEMLREVLKERSPEEVVLVEHCLDKPPKKKADGMLGFGIGHEAVLLLPSLLLIFEEFVKSSATEAARDWGKEFADWMFGEPDKKIDPNAFAKLGHVIRGHLEKQGFSSAEASAISDSVVAAMIGKPSIIRKLVKN